MSRTPNEELVHFLSDLYSMELQAIAQLVTAPDMAEDPELVADFKTHHRETEQQAERVRERLEALGGNSSAIKNAIMKLGGKGFLLFAKLQNETPGRLVAHAYSYEAMEWAGYAMLIRMAEIVGDETTAGLARNIQSEERSMMDRLERGFDAAESISHSETPVEDLRDHLRKHLAEVHAIESQNLKLLEKGEKIAGDSDLAAIYVQHADDTRGQLDLLEQRLESMGSDASSFEDSALKLGALNWGMFFQAQTDTPCKLAAFAYAVAHLEIGSYELLVRTARRAGDSLTEEICNQILAEERAMAKRLSASTTIERCVQATFAELQTR